MVEKQQHLSRFTKSFLPLFGQCRHEDARSRLLKSICLCLRVRRGDEVLLLQVFLQPGQQPGLQSSGGQSSLLLQQRLQCEQLCLQSPAGTQRPAGGAAAAGSRLLPLCFQVDALSQQ